MQVSEFERIQMVCFLGCFKAISSVFMIVFVGNQRSWALNRNLKFENLTL